MGVQFPTSFKMSDIILRYNHNLMIPVSDTVCLSLPIRVSLTSDNCILPLTFYSLNFFFLVFRDIAQNRLFRLPTHSRDAHKKISDGPF